MVGCGLKQPGGLAFVTLCAGLGLGLGLGMAGCAGPSGAPTTTVSASDFATPGTPPPRTPRAASPPREAASGDGRQPREMTPEQARGGIPEGAVSVRIGTPIEAPDRQGDTQPGQPGGVASFSAPGQPTLLDAKVGDINGRAVYASEVLRALENKLRTDAERVRDDPAFQRSAWIQSANQDISLAISEILDSELLRAEALRIQPREIRQYGLRTFIGVVRSNQERSQGAGSAAAARGDLDPAEYERQLEQSLRLGAIQEFLLKPLRERVKISWPQIQAEYERRVASLPKTATARFRGIRLLAGDASTIQSVTEQLASGADFTQLAEQYADRWFFAQPGDPPGSYSVELTGDLADSRIFSGAELNALAQSLGPEGSGKPRTAGPVTSGSSVYWLHLERIESPEAPPLRDAQVAILQDLLNEGVQDELDRYLTRLKNRASSTTPDVMRQRLLRIAIARYLDPIAGASDSSP